MRLPWTDGGTTTHDISKSVGTVNGTVNLLGIWGYGDLSGRMLAYLSGTTTVADYADSTAPETGKIDFVMPVGNAYLYLIHSRFYKTGTRTFHQYYSRYYNSTNSPLRTTIVQGDSFINSVDIETSAIDQGFYLANGAKIKKLTIIGRDYNPENGALIGAKRIDLTSNLTSSGTPTNGVVARLHGEPACYRGTAVADGDDGGTHRKEFNFGLVAPQCAAAGSQSSQLNFTTCDDMKSVGSVLFDCAATAGCTVINTSNIGPEPPANFRVLPFKGGPQYYDIISTVQFCPQTTATVCFNYDPNELPKKNGDPDPSNLKLFHYVCDSIGNCDWEKITPVVYETQNKICGETSSFSIFAVLEPLDKDNDGIFDSEDDCEDTEPNVLVDSKGCSSAQRLALACPLEAMYQNHGQYVSCIAKEAEEQLMEQLITAEIKDAVVSAAAQSAVGKKKR